MSEEADLVARLRQKQADIENHLTFGSLIPEAADTIERLVAERDAFVRLLDPADNNVVSAMVNLQALLSRTSSREDAQTTAMNPEHLGEGAGLVHGAGPVSVHASDNTREVARDVLIDCFDAQVWAREFVKRNAVNPDIAADEGTMIAWFANAIMAGYDNSARKADSQRAPLLAQIAELEHGLDSRVAAEIIKRAHVTVERDAALADVARLREALEDCGPQHAAECAGGFDEGEVSTAECDCGIDARWEERRKLLATTTNAQEWLEGKLADERERALLQAAQIVAPYVDVDGGMNNYNVIAASIRALGPRTGESRPTPEQPEAKP